MSNYRYFSGPYGMTPTIKKGLTPLKISWLGDKTGPSKIATGPAKAGKHLVGPKKADTHLGLSFDTAATVELNTQIRRTTKLPLFQGKAQELLTLSYEINHDLGDVQDSMEGMVEVWRNDLLTAQTRLASFADNVDALDDGLGLEALNWILTFGGAISSTYLTPKNEVEAAISEIKSASNRVERKINAINGYLNDLSKRQKTSQLSTWASGTDLVGMVENVSRSFGVNQREMLQGWWDDLYLSWLRVGSDHGSKSWHPVCDLWRHRVEPRSWADVHRDMFGPPDETIPAGPDSGWGSYGTLTPAGWGGTSSTYVWFLQPREGASGHYSYPSGIKRIWGISPLAEGCLAGEACPIAPWESPIGRAKELRMIQNYGLSLVTTSSVNALINEVEDAMDTISSKLGVAKTKFERLKAVIDTSELYFKGKIRAILEATGGPRALSAGISTLGLSVGGPVGWLVGLALGEFVISQAVGQIWSKLTNGPATSIAKTEIAQVYFSDSVKDQVPDAFKRWQLSPSAGGLVSSSWRSARRTQLTAVRNKLVDWIAIYDSMEPESRYIYPYRNAAQWKRLGVPDPCTAVAPDLPDPGGWAPPDGGLPEDHDFDEPLEALTPYGALAPNGSKTYGGLSGKTWLFIAGVAAGLIYLEKRWQEGR